MRDQNDSVLSGIEVTFSVTAGGGTLGTTSTTQCRAGIEYPYPWVKRGNNTVSVSAAGIQGVLRQKLSHHRPQQQRHWLKSQDQQGVINTALGNPFVVEVRDQTDSVLSGILVTFSVTWWWYAGYHAEPGKRGTRTDAKSVVTAAPNSNDIG